MAEANAWMPLYIGDYLADTMHLSGAEHGAYLLLIMHYWRTGPLPDDDKALAAIARTDLKEWVRVVGKSVRPFFKAETGRLHHKRIDAETAKAMQNSSKRRDAANARWMHTASKRNANASDVHDVSTSNGYDPRAQSPSPSPAKQLLVTQSPRERPAATAENGWIGWLDGKEVVGGIEWDFAWPRIVEAARLDLARWSGDEIPARRWLAEFRDVRPIEAAIRKVAERPDYSPPRTLAYFDKPVREACARSVA